MADLFDTSGPQDAVAGATDLGVAVEGLTARTDALTISTNSFSNAMARAFASASVAGRSFDDVLKSLALRISSLAVADAFKPLTAGISGGLNSLFSGLFPSSGGIGLAAAMGAIKPFAAGGVIGTLDLGGQDVTIQLADGTYASGMQTSPQVGAGTVTVLSNAASPENVIVAAINTQEPGILVSNGASLVLAGFTISSTHFRCINATQMGTVSFSNLRFGTCGDYQMRVGDLGIIRATGAYTIAGGGSCSGHLSAVGNGIIRTGNSPTVTIEAAQTYTDAFASGLTGGNLICTGISFAGAGAGSITGKTYNMQSNSILQLGASTLPGSAAGTATSGAQVI